MDFREPLGGLIGRYEAKVVANQKNKWSMRRADRCLKMFFGKFPKKSAPEQFSLADAEDYRVWRAEEGATYLTVRTELGYVRAFFKFLVEEVPGFENFPIPVVGLPLRQTPTL